MRIRTTISEVGAPRTTVVLYSSVIEIIKCIYLILSEVIATVRN